MPFRFVSPYYLAYVRRKRAANAATLFLRDSFNRADGAIGSPDYGSAYDLAEVSGPGYTLPTITSHQIAWVSGYPAILTQAGSNCSVQATYSGSGNASIYLRALSDGVLGDIFGYVAQIRNGVFELYEYVNNAQYDFLLKATSATAPGAGDVIYAEIRGANITVKINGTTVMTYGSALWPERTRCGLGMFSAGAAFDDLEIYSL